jgi:predicted pyridoxine 5'-phosphate oxidase superfamily flavin-nucleotide-binding protein
MASPWHAGEQAVQARVGETALAERTAGGIQREVPPVAAEFLAAQPFVVLGARDDDGRVWASPLVGDPGFARVPRPDVVEIRAPVDPGDPLAGALAGPRLVGLLAIEPATRRRSRFNGLARPYAGGLRLEVHQAYANCPKYIQKRHIESRPARSVSPPHITAALTGSQQRWLTTADTFFIATTDAGGNADASHRGGNPGFVEVLGPHRFRFPDYLGNHMYMTLGNLEVEPAAGFLFVDWRSGSTLQVSGRAVVDYDADPRRIDVAVDRVVQLDARLPFGWSPPEPSRFNPR